MLFDSRATKHVTDRPLDKDKLAMVSREEAARAAHMALFQLQDLPTPEEILLGVAVLFTAFAKRCSIDPQDLHMMAQRVLSAPEAGDAPTDNSLQVLRDFAGCRILGKDVTIQ